MEVIMPDDLTTISNLVILTAWLSLGTLIISLSTRLRIRKLEYAILDLQEAVGELTQPLQETDENQLEEASRPEIRQRTQGAPPPRKIA